MPEPQRWLTLTGICNVLLTNKTHVAWLVKNKYLTVLWGKGTGKPLENARFLDPTPEYAERLRLAELIYRRRWIVPEDLDVSDLCLVTTREAASILGWSLNHAQQYMAKHKVPTVKTGNYYLYTIASIRDLLWKRQGKKAGIRRCPFLIPEIIAYFMKKQAEAEKLMPLDSEFKDDDILRRKLALMLKMPSPDRERAIAEFHEKLSLAKQIVSALPSASSSASHH